MPETTRLIQFLTDELNVSSNSIALALQQCEQSPNLLPIVLWQYGLINLTELEQIFDWMAESTCVIPNAQVIFP
ncbi:DUF2949 domain-containing protein [Leptolyngbya sp. NIES-2104]|uniref:DUF2949 domain-containing protein n=1 Tax=Leptolyngbya sp. NIES-2104 TaxID=1552121 RepID=UPI0006ECAC18|nr:DUF2949 domain-containing protein [Leptolyngbya sp. NIES-2104]GAP95861.1 hypothetical protein NIES2104_23870 [Leptolyngbya sp. NIES-2104]